MHDPFSMRPFFGYNFGDYLRHWIQLGRFLIMVIIIVAIIFFAVKELEEAASSVYGQLVPEGR